MYDTVHGTRIPYSWNYIQFALLQVNTYAMQLYERYFMII